MEALCNTVGPTSPTPQRGKENMERSAILPTHRPPSKKAAIARLLMTICAIGTALLAAMVAAWDVSAQDGTDPDAGLFQR